MMGNGIITNENLIELDGIEHKIHVIKVVGSGSCLLDAILQSFSKKYIRSESQEEREDIVQEIKNSIISNYFDDLDPEIISALTGINILTYRELPFLQELLKKNIFCIAKKEDDDLDIIKYNSDYSKSICLYLEDNHFDVVGVYEDGITKTHFASNHSFIISLINLISK